MIQWGKCSDENTQTTTNVDANAEYIWIVLEDDDMKEVHIL